MFSTICTFRHPPRVWEHIPCGQGVVGEATVTTNYYGEGEVDLFDSSQQMVKYTETGIITLLSHPSSSVRLYRWSMWQNYDFVIKVIMRILCHKLLLTFATIHLVLPQSFFFFFLLTRKFSCIVSSKQEIFWESLKTRIIRSCEAHYGIFP